MHRRYKCIQNCTVLGKPQETRAFERDIYIRRQQYNILYRNKMWRCGQDSLSLGLGPVLGSCEHISDSMKTGYCLTGEGVLTVQEW